MTVQRMWSAVGCLVLVLSGCDRGSAAGMSKPTHADRVAEMAGGETGGGQETPKPPEKKNPLLDPSCPEMNKTAPAEYKVKFETSQGDFVLKVTREWAPRGADRFYNLVKNGFYNECRFFRCIAGFMVQFGISGDPKISEKLREAKIQDDPVKKSNQPGFLSFAMAGANTRTTQVFINFVDNARLDSMGFPPFGEVTEGMDVVRKLYSEYGEGAPRGRGPDQGRIQAEGNEYLKKDFPKLDFIKTAKVVE